MKLVSVLLAVAILAFALPAMAFNEFENGDAARWAALKYPNITYQEYNRVVDELVKTQHELNTEKVENAKEKRDAIAIAVGVGVFIGSGGAAAAIKLLFPLCKVIPLL